MWEQSSGDCGFPTIKEVREKYPNPLCTIGVDSEEEAEILQEMNDDVKRIVNEYKNNNTWK